MSENKKQFAEIKIGDQASFKVVITEELVGKFSALSGDTNPLHMDDAYAAVTNFKRRVAHGMIGGCLFSRLVGMHLPGKYCLYLSQSLNFKKPIFLGTEVEVAGEVIKKTDAFQTLEINTFVRNSRTGENLIEGKALVKLLK